MIINTSFAIIQTFYGSNRPCADIAIDKLVIINKYMIIILMMVVIVIIIATVEYLLFAKHLAEIFIYIISLNFQSDNGKDR